MKEYLAKLKRIIRNSFVQKWFLTFLLIVFVIFLFFILYAQHNYRKSLQAEYTAYAELQTARIAKDLDDTFRNYSRITALLSINEKVRIFLFSPNPESVISNIHDLLYTQLLSYKEGFSGMDSIYLLCANQKTVLTSSGNETTSTTSLKNSDKTCFLVEEADDKIDFVFREKNDRYPYLATINIPVFAAGSKALISANIDLSKISILQAAQNDPFQQIYILAESGEILYRSQQKGIPESREIIPQLASFDPSLEDYSFYSEQNASFVYVQTHSEDYPWYYVTVTTPQVYAGKPYDFYSSVLSLLPWLFLLSLVIIIWLVLLTSRPIRTISDFLENPLTQVPEHISESETTAIIHKLVNYIQTNQNLSDELKVQMDLQTQATFWALQSQINPHFLFNTLNIIRKMEMDALGYEHEVPELTLNLSRLLQYALESTELVTLSKEFQYMDLYLKILNKRYKDRLLFTVHMTPEVADVYVPKLILQPLVENAIFHGCVPRLNISNHIEIRASASGQQCVIMIKDNGIGIPPQDLLDLRQKITNARNIPTNSIGLQNTCVRLYLTYGENYHMDIDSEVNRGTCLTLYIPVRT